LIRSPCSVANHDRQNVDAQMIVIRSPHCAADQEAPVAATEIDDQRRRTAEQGGQIQRSLYRQFLEGGLRPLAGNEDLAGERYAEFAFDVSSFLAFIRHGVSPTASRACYPPDGLSAAASDCARSPMVALTESSDWLSAFSRWRTTALPTMMPSATSRNVRTCSGRLMPKPTHKGKSV